MNRAKKRASYEIQRYVLQNTYIFFKSNIGKQRVGTTANDMIQQIANMIFSLLFVAYILYLKGKLPPKNLSSVNKKFMLYQAWTVPALSENAYNEIWLSGGECPIRLKTDKHNDDTERHMSLMLKLMMIVIWLEPPMFDVCNMKIPKTFNNIEKIIRIKIVICVLHSKVKSLILLMPDRATISWSG